MSLGDAARFRELEEHVEKLYDRAQIQHEEIAVLKLRLSSLQGQMNSLRARRSSAPDGPMSTDDAA